MIGGRFRVLVALVVTWLSGSGVVAQGASWPESCRADGQTIFDRVVEVHDTLLMVPEVSRHEPDLGLTGRYVDVGEVRLWVEEMGSGPAVLLLSGGPGTSHHYFHPHLLPAARFARLIYVDLRGVGLSDRDPEGRYSIEQAVADIEGLREALDLERWVVLGNSFGGSLAMVYALEHPERLAGVILSSSAVPMSVDVGLGERQREYMAPEEIRRVAQIYSVAGEGVVPAHADWVTAELQAVMVYNGFRNGDWKRRHLCRMNAAEIARYARYEWVHDRNYYRQMAADHGRLDLEGRFRETTVPMLVLEGRWDLAFGAHKPEVMAEEFPEARLVVLPDAGHTLFEDDPAGFFEAVRGFIGSLAAGSRPGAP